jgi:hypothetical protein
MIQSVLDRSVAYLPLIAAGTNNGVDDELNQPKMK